MIRYPQIDPTLIRLGPLEIRWYGLMYILAFVFGYLLLKKRARETAIDVDANTLMDFAFYLFVGVLAGGRLGYILFYNPIYFVTHPLEIFALWHGGMSFHGGMIGTIVAGFIFCWQKRIDFYRMADTVIPVVPIGLGLGRLGNFINGELWGRPSESPWAMIFPTDPTGLPRHPSQLYEFFLEGLVLFAVLWLLRKRQMPAGTLFWIFAMLYGAFRLFAEFYREPDAHLSFLFPNVTAGMLLSLPMFLIGAAMIALGYARRGRRLEQAETAI